MTASNNHPATAVIGGQQWSEGGPEMSTAVTNHRAAPARVAAVDSSAPTTRPPGQVIPPLTPGRA